MILTDQKSKFSTNVDESNSMDFGIGDPSVIIEILRNRMYENKIQTLVQEYISNARDANREINSKNKVKVTFPTSSNPNFIVRDFGPGVSPDRMKNVFVLYGVSTKRGTNTQTGGFGLGAKSAWAYTNSFTIITFVDGVKRTYVAHIDGSKNGQLTMMDESETNEENGTLISISVERNDINDFCKAIIRSTMFWQEDEYPEFDAPENWQKTIEFARKVGIQRFMGSNMSGVTHDNWTGISDNTMIIDGIPYPMPNIYSEEYNKIKNLIGGSYQKLNVFIPNGLVQIAASREKIDNSEISKKAFKEIFVSLYADFLAAKKRWEDSIVDTDSLLSAIDRASDFKLSTEKMFDGVKLTHGVYYLSFDEDMFEMRNVFPQDVNFTTAIANENKYYLERKSALPIKDIKKWIRNQYYSKSGIKSIQLITILARKEEKCVNSDGETYWKLKRDDEYAKELIETVKRLGYKNIEELIPKPEKVKRVSGYSPGKIAGTVYKLDKYGYENKVELEDIKGVKPNKPWVIFYGRKSDYSYGDFQEKVSNLVELGAIEAGFRVIESNRKYVENDKRFIEIDEFMKTWNPDKKVVLQFLYNQIQNKNIIDILAVQSSTFYKIANIKLESNKIYYNYSISYMITESQVYKNIVSEIQKLNAFISTNFPLVASGYNCTPLHLKEYIFWRFELAEKSGKVPTFQHII